MVSVAGMKDWPPKPGLTDMRRMMSTLSMTYLRQSSGVACAGDGFTEAYARPLSEGGAQNTRHWSCPFGERGAFGERGVVEDARRLAGLKTRPALQPLSRMSESVRSTCGDA